jgi:hypothetical protein
LRRSTSFGVSVASKDSEQKVTKRTKFSFRRILHSSFP